MVDPEPIPVTLGATWENSPWMGRYTDIARAQDWTEDPGLYCQLRHCAAPVDRVNEFIYIDRQKKTESFQTK